MRSSAPSLTTPWLTFCSRSSATASSARASSAASVDGVSSPFTRSAVMAWVSSGGMRCAASKISCSRSDMRTPSDLGTSRRASRAMFSTRAAGQAAEARGQATARSSSVTPAARRTLLHRLGLEAHLAVPRLHAELDGLAALLLQDARGLLGDDLLEALELHAALAGLRARFLVLVEQRAHDVGLGVGAAHAVLGGRAARGGGRGRRRGRDLGSVQPHG